MSFHREDQYSQRRQFPREVERSVARGSTRVGSRAVERSNRIAPFPERRRRRGESGDVVYRKSEKRRSEERDLLARDHNLRGRSRSIQDRVSSIQYRVSKKKKVSNFSFDSGSCSNRDKVSSIKTSNTEEALGLEEEYRVPRFKYQVKIQYR